MKIEPSIDYSTLTAHLRDLYGLPIQTLTFVPQGECSAGYIVDCADGRRCFLKLWPDSRLGNALVRRMNVVLPIVHELRERRLLDHLSSPLQAGDGRLMAKFGTYTLALFTFVEGKPLIGPVQDWPPGVMEEIASIFARLHKAADQLKSPLPEESAFSMDFADDLRRGLAALDGIGPSARPGLQDLRSLLLPRRGELLHSLEETFALASAAQAAARKLVLCHTDLGGNNVLVSASPDGRPEVGLLDWDGLILAPPEQDLQEYRDSAPASGGLHGHNTFSSFLRLYWQSGGVRPLDPLQFRFYLQRRYLADLTDWLIRILEENSQDAQDANDLNGIKTYCLAYLDNFSEEMRLIEQAVGS